MARLLVLISVLVFAVAACYAAEPAGQVYWNKVLPNTPIPGAIKDLLTKDELTEDKSAVVNVGKGGVTVNTGKGTTVNVGHGGVSVNPGKGPIVNVGHGTVGVSGGKGPTVNVGHGGVGVNTGKGTSVTVGKGGVGVETGKGTSVNVGKGGVGVETGKGTSVNVGKGGVGVETGKGTSVNVGKGGVGVDSGKGTSVNVGKGGVGVNTGKGTSVNVGHGGVGVNTGKGKPGSTRVNVGKGGVTVGVKTPPKKKPVFVNVAPFLYKYAATETQVHDDPNVALFFLEKELQPGTKMTLQFTPTTSGTAFVSRREANSVPFSSSKLPQILNHFSVDPNSAEADAMKTTLTECEDPAMTGETKYCATSLESMVEFSTLSLGTRKVAAVSTTADKQNSPKQQYTILSSGVKKLSGSNNLVVCHAQNYAHAVFYCHTTHSTRAYEVSMAGEDGTKVEAVAVCHTNTAGWNPKHVAFQVLGVKPGTVPVCHFLPQDHVVWSPKKN